MSGIEVAAAVAIYMTVGVVVGAVLFISDETINPLIHTLFVCFWPLGIIAFASVAVAAGLMMASAWLGCVMLNVRERLK